MYKRQSQSNVSADDIKGVGLSGQMHGLVMLDAQNQPIRKSIIWCDQRTAKEVVEITDKVGADRMIEITANPAITGFTAAKIMWVKNNEPQNYEKCRHILLPKDYIRFMLTGEFATEVSDASGMQLLDIPNRCWSDEVLNKLGIDKALLAKIRLQALKVYINIQNLKTWKHNTGYTPELGGSATTFGVDDGSYPVPAVYTFGINLTF